MDVQAVSQMITTVGFPIVMCLILCWYVKYMTDSHKEELASLKKSLDENTKILNELFSCIKFLKGDDNNGGSGD